MREHRTLLLIEQIDVRLVHASRGTQNEWVDTARCQPAELRFWVVELEQPGSVCVVGEESVLRVMQRQVGIGRHQRTSREETARVTRLEVTDEIYAKNVRGRFARCPDWPPDVVRRQSHPVETRDGGSLDVRGDVGTLQRALALGQIRVRHERKGIATNRDLVVPRHYVSRLTTKAEP